MISAILILIYSFLGHRCGIDDDFVDNLEIWFEQLNQTSVMFSKDRKQWIEGPSLPEGLKFTDACGISLHRSKILFVGVSSMPFELNPNDVTITYDFEEKKWQFQGMLPSLDDKSPLYDTSCVMNFEKNLEKRLVT